MNILGLRSGSSAFEGDQSDGDIRFFSEFAFEARFKHTFERGWGQTASTDLSGQRKRDHPGRADEDLAIELRILINRDADHIARLQRLPDWALASLQQASKSAKKNRIRTVPIVPSIASSLVKGMPPFIRNRSNISAQ